MRNALLLVFATVATAAVTMLVWSYFSQGGPAVRPGGNGGPAMLAGAPAATYVVKRLDGQSDSLGRYRGKVALVNLWASWCAPCRSETPALERLYEEDRGRGLVVLGIDQGESPEAASAFVREMGLQYPILLDDGQQYGRAYAAVGLPTSIVVDRSGHIVRGIDGEMTLEQMHDAVDPVLAKK
jgi:thiol-disulfide isomerase/thioredoxin